MTILRWHDFMQPVLEVMVDGRPRDRADVIRATADLVGLDDIDRLQLLRSGEPRYANRIGWAISHLARAGALARPARARYVVTDLGIELVGSRSSLSLNDVALPLKIARDVPVTPLESALDSLGPLELIDQGIQRIEAEVARELIDRLQEGTPVFFERAVVQLLVAMGYGGADARATVTQQVNDGGIDGVIDQDPLGLNRVYVQAKRYSRGNRVGRPEVQGFVGALSGIADRGIFITTSEFSAGALEYAESALTRIILVDGRRLVELMTKYGVGVQTRQIVNVVELDEDFFE